MRWFTVVPALFLAAGCSLSTSAEMGSDSSRSSESSSRSSTSDAKKDSRYREDVRTYTAAHVRSGGSREAFEKTLGELARRHGVTNWEEDPATLAAMGEGMAEADGVR